MKPREERRKVLLNARMRLGASWGNARILNISSRGLLVESPVAPERGSYVEVRRGQHMIVARVIWNDDSRFGLLTQDPLTVDSIISEPDRSKSAKAVDVRDPTVERRAARRAAELHAQKFATSRLAARSFQFAAIAAFGTSAAVGAYATVRESLQCPMARVAAALGADEVPVCR